MIGGLLLGLAAFPVFGQDPVDPKESGFGANKVVLD
jgi:hypothetical protein